MNTLNFPDVNVWMAIIWGQHVHTERAQEWFQSASTEQFFFCRFTQLGVLRLLTTRSIMGKDTKSMSEAWTLLDRLWTDHANIVATRTGGHRCGIPIAFPAGNGLSESLGRCVFVGVRFGGGIEAGDV